MPSPAQCPLGLRPQYTRCSVVVEGGPPLGKCASKRSLLLSRPGVRFFHRCTAVPLRARERKETYSASLASFPHLQCAVLYGHSCPFQAFAFIPSLAWPKMNKCFFFLLFRRHLPCVVLWQRRLRGRRMPVLPRVEGRRVPAEAR